MGKIGTQMSLLENVKDGDASQSDGRRRSPKGDATTHLVFSSYVGDSSDLFPLILQLHVPRGSVVADVTYGKGVFWRKVPPGDYIIRPTDLKMGVDCRALPYQDGEIDCVVLDPPYMEGLYRNDSSIAGQGTHETFQDRYSNGERPRNLSERWHNAVVEMYVQAAIEARRVLKDNGTLIVKCQDEVSAGVQRLTHVEIVLNYAALGFYAKDLFILTRPNKPGVSRVIKQLHARKNHSYFVVFLKGGTDSQRKAIAVMRHLLDDLATQKDQVHREP